MLFLIAVIAAVVAFFVYTNAKKRMNKSEASFALIGIVVALLIALSQSWTITCWTYRGYRFPGKC